MRRSKIQFPATKHLNKGTIAMVCQILSRAVILIGALLILGVSLVRDGRAQEAEPPGDQASGREESDERLVLQVFRLGYARAEDASEVIAAVFPADVALRLAVDARTNSLLVQASSEVQNKVAAVLKTIDSPVGAADAAGPDGGSTNQRLVFYWLASGPDFTTEAPLPSHLEPVVEELQRFGLGHIQLVCRSIAAFDGDEVRIGNTVDVAGRSYRLDFDGQLSKTPNAIRDPSAKSLKLNANVIVWDSPQPSQRQGGPTSKSCSLQTTITTPHDHFVVLGVTGLGDLENAFVIQIQTVEPGSDGGGKPPAEASRTQSSR